MDRKPVNTQNNQESGMALLPTIILLTLIAVFVLIFLMQEQNASVTIANHETHHLEMLALDQGAEDASSVLNNYADWPEVLTASNATALAPAYQSLPANVYPSAPTLSFWENCATQNQCATYSVTEDGITLTGEYVIYPANGLTEPLSGYEEENQQPGPTSRQYIAYVRVQNQINDAAVVKEFVLRKSLL